MKYALLIGLTTFSLNSMAGSCKLSSWYYEGFHCPKISTKITTVNEEQCQVFAQNTRDEKFFGILTAKDERVLRTKYVYKDSKRKVSDVIDFEDIDEVCF
jgi:hypothetical protein